MMTRTLKSGVLALLISVVPAAAESRYQTVENWAQFPPGMTKWAAATGVEVDSHDNVYVFQRNPAMPVVVFDRNGKFLRSWASDIKFGQTHFLRVDRFGDIWLTDRGDMQAFKFTPDGKLLLTIGKKGVKGDNNSQDAFNGMADVAIAKNGDFFIADGEGPNTRVVKFNKEGKFIKWWGGKGKEPGQFDQPHTIAIDSKGFLYVGDRSNDRIQIFDQDGKFIKQWTNFGTPWGVFIRGNKFYCVDGTKNNVLYVANLKDGKIIEKIEGLNNATAVTVDSKGTIYLGEVTGVNVRKLVKK